MTRIEAQRRHDVEMITTQGALEPRNRDALDPTLERPHVAPRALELDLDTRRPVVAAEVHVGGPHAGQVRDLGGDGLDGRVRVHVDRAPTRRLDGQPTRADLTRHDLGREPLGDADAATTRVRGG